jgi:release factor glutamine methyltransferase
MSDVTGSQNLQEIGDAIRDGARRLAGAGLENARLDARLLLGSVLGRDVWPHESAPLQAEEQVLFDALLNRRIAREPVSRILGRRGFWTLEIEVGPDVLVPRPDSETLIEAARDHAAIRVKAGMRPPKRILDLGTGSGALLLAALRVFEDATGLGLDLSENAVTVAKSNAIFNQLESRAKFAIGNWSDLICEPADLILSNPPYIATADLAELDPEVRDHDPGMALDGGADGLHCYRTLAVAIPRLLAVDGLAVLELGRGQAADVGALMQAAGLTVLEVRADLGGIERAMVLTRN